jgi:hypothetical protein
MTNIKKYFTTLMGSFFMSDRPLIQDLIHFIKDPKKYLVSTTTGNLNKFRLVFDLTSVTIFVVFIVGFVTNYIVSKVGYSQDQNNIVLESLSGIPAWVSLLLVIIVGPITEELAFRFFLKADKIGFLLGSLFYFYFVSNTLLNYFSLDKENFYTLTLALAGLFGFVLSYFLLHKDTLRKYITSHFRALVYFSAVSFGLIHITNYENIGKYWWLTPLLVFPQLIVGFVLPFVRTKAGFIWSFLTHSLYNFILAIYPLGLLLGPGKVSELIKNTNDSAELISNFTRFENTYTNILTLLSTAVYLVVLMTGIKTISNYLRVIRGAKII